MTNFQKRILTSIIILPLSIFFIVKGNNFLLFFSIFILFVGLHELFTSFKRIITRLSLSCVLFLFIFSINSLSQTSEYLLYLTIAVSVSSDIGGYVFGKIFKWKKLTKISPKKTISGVFGSYFCSLIIAAIFHEVVIDINQLAIIPKELLVIIFSTIAQAGDLIISYFKRLEKIKDTGKILPGHGGIFDRIDGLMFVVIATYFFLT